MKNVLNFIFYGTSALPAVIFFLGLNFLTIKEGVINGITPEILHQLVFDIPGFSFGIWLAGLLINGRDKKIFT